MARKQAKKAGMTPAAEPVTKPVRLDLTPETHRLLRIRAAEAGMSMAAYARMLVAEAVQAKPKGAKH